MINCIIAGVGGQGTVLASKLIAEAAMSKGMNVRTTETIGMAQRGGCVVSHVRMGEHINSPLVPLNSSDVIIAFEPAEAVRVLPYLAENGLMIVCDSIIKPVTSSLSGDSYAAKEMTDYLSRNTSRLIVVSGKQLLAECKNPKVLNVALLGVAAESSIFPFDAETARNIVQAKIPERFLEMNLAAFDIGRKIYNETV